MNFYMPTKIVVGKDCVKNSCELVKSYGKKALIVTGKSSAKKCGALDDVTDMLSKINCEYEVFNKIEQNPTIQSCIEGGQLAKDISADFIIGIGGGSPLDASKAIAVFSKNTQMSEQDFYNLNWKYSPLPIIAVGTTAGTGSEVTQVAVITNTSGMKKSIRHDLCFPVLALGDAKYTTSLDDKFTRSTAADALAHCIESYFNETATDLSRIFATRGTKILVNEMQKICDGKATDFKTRENLYKASLYGGLAISVTGTNFPHAMSYFLSENHSVPHGAACAFYLPEFLDHNLNADKKLCDDFSEMIGISIACLKDLIKEFSPKVNVVLTQEQKDELKPRWQNNSCLKKCLGGITPEYLENKINKLF